MDFFERLLTTSSVDGMNSQMEKGTEVSAQRNGQHSQTEKNGDAFLNIL